ncbi:hypothetical protein FNJ88_10930 [Chryseobacterium sp. SNU WT5]|uniref:hypothetical protein n=1 Tax=Chryseobacterium sp. SNU WT5 TaxID=2594269 RepID=UPI00117D9DB6|nr:hypothetical protein [Chryseobacterium sp. SNU WT5]QDP86032.1 hypothetical protein FNJ88_10930 [Chryseobacterium sp. SNU WT5]
MYTSDRKILELVELLKSENKISSDKEFCEIIEINPANFAKIKKSENYPNQSYHFTPLHIENVCKKLNIDSNWIFNLSDEKYKQKINKTLKKTTKSEYC